jgi:hypothetical protein
LVDLCDIEANHKYNMVAIDRRFKMGPVLKCVNEYWLSFDQNQKYNIQRSFTPQISCIGNFRWAQYFSGTTKASFLIFGTKHQYGELYSVGQFKSAASPLPV